MKKGFTLAELLIVVVILAILAAIALPNFTKAMEKAKANQAIALLRTLRVGEQMYYSKNGTYACPGLTACDTPAEIKAVLGVEVPAASFQSYGFDVINATNTTFTARARRTINSDAVTITLNQDGNFGQTNLPAYVTWPPS